MDTFTINLTHYFPVVPYLLTLNIETCNVNSGIPKLVPVTTS